MSLDGTSIKWRKRLRCGGRVERVTSGGGIYDACDEALGPAAAARLAEELESFPEPPLTPYNDGPEIRKHIEENLALARRRWMEPAEGKR